MMKIELSRNFEKLQRFQALTKKKEVKSPPDALLVESTADYSFAPEGFYCTLRGRVREFFKAEGIKHPNCAGVRTLATLAAWATVFLATWAYCCLYMRSVSFANLAVLHLNSWSRLALTGAWHDAIHDTLLPGWPILKNLLFHLLGAMFILTPSQNDFFFNF